jgi:hypothetical protein
LIKIEEGQREVPKLQAALARMAGPCRAGSNPGNLKGTSPTISLWGELGEAMKALDGWAISLLETDITLLMIIQNPQTGAIRVKSLHESFSNLWDVRARKYSPIDRHPELFDLTFL